MDNYKYVVFSDCLHINSDVGATGRYQIYSFWSWLKQVGNDNVIGYEVDNALFDSLTWGQVYPGILEGKRRSQWAEDFKDIDMAYPVSQRYEEFYGAEFIRAQEIVRRVRTSIKHGD